MLHIGQILEKVQMVGLYIQNHRHGGEEIQKGVAIFTGLQNDGVAVAYPVAGVQQRKRSANHHSGICLSGHEDVSSHGGGGGFAWVPEMHRAFLYPCMMAPQACARS